MCDDIWRIICFCQAEDGIRDDLVTGVQTCALPISQLHQTTRPECDCRRWEQSADYQKRLVHSPCAASIECHASTATPTVPLDYSAGTLRSSRPDLPRD